MITPEEIRLLPRRYAIGKRPLSLLLGWGELTYTRLLDGNTPSPAHAEELRRLYDDPALYARTLEVGRGRITPTAYERSLNAVDALLEEKGGAAAAGRIFEVADRLCFLAEGDLTPRALQQLVFCAQGLGFARLGAPLFEELPLACADGPAYATIAQIYSFDEIQRAGAQGEPDAPSSANKAQLSYSTPKSRSLTDEELAVVDEAYRKFGTYSGQELSRIAREGNPWKKARKRAGSNSADEGAEPITAKSMRKYFAKL